MLNRQVEKPFYVIVVAQQKGGVGKTTDSRMLGEYFSLRREVPTLLIDYDPQCNLSSRYLRMEKPSGAKGFMPPVHPAFDPEQEYEDNWNGRSSSADIFLGDALPYPTEVTDNLHILPGDGMKLRLIEQQKPQDIAEGVVGHTKEWLSSEDVRAEYEVVIIDTGPNRLALTQSATRAATHILIPILPEPLNTETLSDMIDLWRDENRLRTPDNRLDILGIVPNLVKPRNRLHKDLIDTMHNDPALGPLMAPFVLHSRSAVPEADHEMSRHQSVFELPAKDKARQEAEVFCKFVEEKLYGNVSE